jgi:tetratricopeptide (TPR) repeat protein
VRDLLRSRLASIDEKAGQLLTTAAVIGRSFDFDTLREASGRSEIETVTGLEALIERKLVQERAIGSEKPGMVYDFSHDKLRELVYTDSSLSRRRLLHRRVAEALVSQVRSTRQEAGGLTSQIAHHYRLSGNEPLAADYYKLAGDHARSVFANREALGHYQSALALGYADVPVLHESIGDLQTLLGDYSAALSSYETAAALSLPERLATLEHKIGDIHHRRGEWELAECHYQAALESLPGKGAQEQRARLYADWSLTAFQRGQIEQARSLAKNALELANAIQVSPALAQAYNVQGILARNLGDTVGALRHLTESLRVAEDLGDANALIAAFNNLALAHRDHGELEKAFQLTRKALELCIQLGDRHRQAALLNNLADLYHAAGQPEEAMAHLKKAVSIFTEIGVEMDQTSPEIWKLTEW